MNPHFQGREHPKWFTSLGRLGELQFITENSSVAPKGLVKVIRREIKSEVQRARNKKEYML